MFFVFPLAHESQSARRWPLVTIVLVLLCAVFFLITTFGFSAQERAVMVAVDRVKAFEATHSQAGLEDCDVREQVRHATSPQPRAAVDDPLEAEHDALCRSIGAAVGKLPVFAYGDVPARGGVLTPLSHQFLHGGWLHLIFNMWFLWLCGVNLEDRWGRWLFLGFYLCSGVAGALLHRALGADPMVPVIGASGAIAGAMGGFLVTMARTRITFGYAFIYSLHPRVGTFQSPAYVMLPLWLATELLGGWLTPNDGTAHWAHVGGFAFGAVAAAVLKLTGADARLDDLNEKKVTTSQDPRLLAAMELTDAGRHPEALAAIDALLRERPDDVDAWLEMLRAATAARDERRQLVAYQRLVGLYLATGAVHTAGELVDELRLQGRLGALPAEALLGMGEALARKGVQGAAAQCFAHAHRDGLVDVLAVRAAVLHATLLARSNRAEDARALLLQARSSSWLTPEIAEKVEAQLALVERISGRPAAG